MARPSWHHSSSSLSFSNCWLSCSSGVTLFYHQLDLAFQKAIFISMAPCYKIWVKDQKSWPLVTHPGFEAGACIYLATSTIESIQCQDFNPGVQDVWGIHTSCSRPHVCYVGIWTWGIHTHRSLVKFVSCCEVQCKIIERRRGSNQLKCPVFFSCCWVRCKITEQTSGLHRLTCSAVGPGHSTNWK